MEWLNKTNKTLHCMRDNPYHGVPILGGLWGVKISDNNRKKLRKIRDGIFSDKFGSRDVKGLDQTLLKVHISQKLAFVTNKENIQY